MRTYSPKPEDIKRDWLVVDVKNIPIGRAASQIASWLRGKHKTTFSPHVDMGDAVIVLNAAEVGATGKKEHTKYYHRHSGYPGGIKSVTLGKLRASKPERIIQLAVKNMLPKGPLGRQMFKKLWVYAGTEHPHQAQQPKEISF
jgi:large subunit ribosomal protein L13